MIFFLNLYNKIISSIIFVTKVVNLIVVLLYENGTVRRGQSSWKAVSEGEQSIENILN